MPRVAKTFTVTGDGFGRSDVVMSHTQPRSLKRMIAILPVLLLVAAPFARDEASPCCFQAKSRPSGPLEVLFIGNSLTYFNNLPAMLEKQYGRAEQEVGWRVAQQGRRKCHPKEPEAVREHRIFARGGAKRNPGTAQTRDSRAPCKAAAKNWNPRLHRPWASLPQRGCIQ